MNHNDLHAFSAKCEDVVIDLPHSGRGCRLRPHPRRRNRPPDPVGTCAAAAPQWQCSALPVPVGSVLLSHPTPLALHQRRRAMPNGPPLCRPIATSPLIRINAASKCELAPTFNGTSSAAMLLCGVVGTITEMRLRRFMRASAAKVGQRRSPSWVSAESNSRGWPGGFLRRPPTQDEREDQKQKPHGCALLRAKRPAVALRLSFLFAWVDATGMCPWPGRWAAQGREPHGPEACLGRVGQDAQPRSCRVRRTAHTSKRRPSLQGRTCSGPCAAHLPEPPHE